MPDAKDAEQSKVILLPCVFCCKQVLLPEITNYSKMQMKFLDNWIMESSKKDE